MSQKDTLFGVVMGAAVVGATLIVKDMLDDPEKVAALREKIDTGCRNLRAKVGEGIAVAYNKVGEAGNTVRAKVQEGYADACQKAGDVKKTLRNKVEGTAPVQKIKKTVDDIRRKAEPAAPYFKEEEDVLNPSVEDIIESTAE